MKFSVFYEHIAEAAVQEQRSVESVCQEISALNIKGVEIENTRLIKEKEEILNALKSAGMEISCMYGFFDFAHTSDLNDGMKMVDLAEECHIKKVMLIPGFLEDDEFETSIYKEKVDKMIHVLKQVCEYAKKKDIMVVLEDFDDKKAPFATSKQMNYFYENIPDLYCAFDTGNFLYSEENALEVLPLFLGRIGHVHCKDRSLAAKEGETPKATIKGRDMYSSPVGSGCIPMKEILSKIIETGYNDYVAIEHFGSMNQLQDMKISIKWLMENI